VPVVLHAELRTALVRAQLLEQLAGDQLAPQQLDNAFLASVLSMLAPVLSESLPDSLAQIAVPHEVSMALIDGQGNLVPFLQLAQTCTHPNERFSSAQQSVRWRGSSS
jgi:c-di-GMP-related signal transduction protein